MSDNREDGGGAGAHQRTAAARQLRARPGHREARVQVSDNRERWPWHYGARVQRSVDREGWTGHCPTSVQVGDKRERGSTFKR